MLRFLQEKELIKIILPSVLAVMLFTIAIFCITLPTIERNLITKKKEKLRHVTQVAVDILGYYHHLEKTGGMSREKAQHRAGEQIARIRYGKERKDYFWINDMQPRMVMHPYRPELNGRDLSRFEDSRGKKLFTAFVRTVRDRGSGYVDYHWQWKDNPDRIGPKLSFVKAFTPWNWIIGTGLYTDDVDREINKLTRDLVTYSTAILALVGLLNFYVVSQGLTAVRRRKKHEEELHRYHNHLEELVAGRTRQLRSSNERLTAEIAEKKKSEEKYRKLIETAIDAVLVSDLETGEILQVNRSAGKLLGLPPPRIIGSRQENFISPVDRYEQFIRKFHTYNGKGLGIINGLHVMHRNGRRIPVEVGVSVAEWSGRRVVQGIFRDITQRKIMEKNLCQSQKLEAVGTLAGGIAHDFNNILTVILGYAELTLTEIAPESQAENNLTKIIKAGHRARDLVSRILTFSKYPFGHEDKDTIALQDAVLDALKLLRSTITKTIEIRPVLDSTCPPVYSSFSQIQQVVFNLCTNAYHAMRETGGVLEVRVEQRYLPAEVAEAVNLQPGNYAVLTVRDNGPGMDEYTLSRIFDPYFTTKGINEGTGLGLATVQGIVRTHQGGIKVDSRPGSGSIFEIFFPLDHRESGYIEVPEEIERYRELPRIDKTILFVDDETMIARLGELYLEQLGCRVTPCSSSPEALDEFTRNPDDYDIVITDQAMPVLSGVDLAAKIRQIRPDILIFVITGYSDIINEDNAREKGIDEFLMKPLDLGKILAALERYLP